MTDHKSDITTEADVVKMVDTFYARVQEDELLSYVFNDFAKVDWPRHLPTMYAFWKSLLLNIPGYKGSPFAAHVKLPIDKSHFNRWLQLFTENVDEHFEGKVAEEAKQRARSIAGIFQHKLEFIKKD
jgi:hemoglobin